VSRLREEEEEEEEEEEGKKEEEEESSLNLCTGGSLTGVMIPDAI